MKKIILSLLVAGIFAACSNNASPEKNIKDSLDSVEKLKKESIDQAAASAKDTIEKHTDSLEKKVDSLADHTRDSLNK